MRRLRQILLAAAVVLLHAFVIYVLIVARQSAPQHPAESLTWIPIRNQALKPATIAPLETFEAAPPKRDTTFNPPALTSLPPIVIAPDQDPTQAVLRDFVACALPENGKIWTEERERCQDITREIHDIEVVKHVPTDEEEKLALKFARAKADQDAPVKAPCFNGISFSLVCMINRVANGSSGDE